MALLDEIKDRTIRGKRKEIGPLIQQGLDEGMNPQELLDAMIAGMDVIGDRFSKGECFVPEMLVAARTMAAGTDILKPALAAAGSEPIGKAVIGTVKGDMHDIGKNLVRMMIESKGVEIDDLGVDVPDETFVQYIQEHPECQVLCLSALLTTPMPARRHQRRHRGWPARPGQDHGRWCSRHPGFRRRNRRRRLHQQRC